jgi:hypothetical protein
MVRLSLDLGFAAVGAEDDPGDVAALRRGEPQDRIGDLVGRSQTAHRNPRHQPGEQRLGLFGAVGESAEAGCTGRTGSDDIHPDALLGEFDGPASCE